MPFGGAPAGHIFVLLPGQLQSDAIRVQIEDVCPNLVGVLLSVMCFGNQMSEMVTAKRPPEIFHSDCGWQTVHILEDGKLSGHVRDGNLHKYGPFIALNVYTILHLNVGNGVWLAEKV